jgi:cytidyltransferase-like protein
MTKRIMVDMSATILHHGHIRLLKKASEYGDVIVGLTTDEEIFDKKGYQVELEFAFRKEILESVKYVKEVVGTPWQITSSTLDEFNIDLLLHGDDNSNDIASDRMLILPRTDGVSSSGIRINAQRSIIQKNNQKLMLTPGPAVVLHENVKYLKPIFGRGDDEYTQMSEAVIEWIKKLSGQDELVMAQGSATFALEMAAHSFVSGKVLLVSTGYYSDRLEKLLPKGCNIEICNYENLVRVDGQFDWVLCAYTETSIAFKIDLNFVRNIADECGAKLYVDATGSIGLESHHELADVAAFSSCKGLFGLTGAGFVAYKSDLHPKATDSFYSNLETQKNKMTTGPYHAIASLYGVIEMHNVLKQRVINSKKLILEKYKDIVRESNQPLLCTYLDGEVKPKDSEIVLYSPRSELSGSVICHFGEIHTDNINIHKRIDIISH